MRKIQFKTDIKSSKENVWKALWNDLTYREWTRPFSDGSYVVTDWKQGSKAHFLSPSGDGMYSSIETNVPNEKMSFKHIGEVREFKEQPLDEKSEKWTGSMENYSLSQNGDTTTLITELDSDDEFADYFTETFPKALEALKKIAEEKMVVLSVIVNAPIEKVWKYWTQPEHITKWNFASDDWHCPKATNDLKEGGHFSCTMAAKDNSMSFDFGGTYTLVKEMEAIDYTLDDNRKVIIRFRKEGDKVILTEAFETESENSSELQRNGWQSILNNFKKHVEGN